MHGRPSKELIIRINRYIIIFQNRIGYKINKSRKTLGYQDLLGHEMHVSTVFFEHALADIYPTQFLQRDSEKNKQNS